MDFRSDVCWAAQAACLLEVASPKVGNVNRGHDFPDCRMEDFLVSALAIGPPMGRAHLLPVGLTVLESVRATRRAVPVNTNLGMILLFAPVAKAWGARTVGGEGEIPPGRDCLRSRVAEVLSGLTRDDARQVYVAIREVSPGGLGRSERADVAEEPDVTLLEAMEVAADRDLVAREYVTDFAVTFDETIPYLEDCLARGLALPHAVAQTHLLLLTRYRDTLIVRKRGTEVAAAVQRMAQSALMAGGFVGQEGRRLVEELDTVLRADGNSLNPGTTADLVAAGLFVLLLERGPELWLRYRTGADPACW